MRSSARRVLLTLLTFLCLAASSFAQSPAKQQPAKTPRGSVSGRVTIKDKPAVGIVVGVRRSDLQNLQEPFTKAAADADGVYRITNLAPGAYQISVAAPGYVLSAGNDRKSIVVGEDENIEGINFTLVRGGVITGKVTDAEGRPVIAQQVQIFTVHRLERRTPEQPPFPAAVVQTDDRGVYRVFGLAAGRYKVAAGRGDEGFGSYSPTRVKYPQAFHPDTTDPAKATIVEVSEGSEANNVDITLGRAVQTFAVSGRVINSETGRPVPNMVFSLQRLLGQRVEYVNTAVKANARGDFTVEGLIPGKYGVMVFPTETNDLRAEAVTFDVVDQDVSGVTVKLSRGATVSGMVILETEEKAAHAQFSQLLMRGHVQQGTPGVSAALSSKIAPDGSFQLIGLGTGALSLNLGGTVGPYPPKGFVISRIERDGIVTPRIEVKDGEQVTGVKVFIGYGTAILRGTVKIENGPLPAGARLFLRLVKPGETLSYVRPPIVDERNSFLLDGIPAGLYELTAQIMGANVRGLKPVRQNVSLTTGAVTEVTVTIDVATLANP